MAQHTVSKKDPTHVTGADQYRVSFTATLTPSHPQFEQMQEYVRPEHRDPEGYGLAFLESEEHSVTYIGSVQQILDYQAVTDGTAVLDVSQGVLYAFWPHGKGWDEYLPATTWNESGEGIVTEFDHPRGGKITVYEYRDDKKRPMVGFHCEQCHPTPEVDHEVGLFNRGPHDRRWSARGARMHIRNHAERCRRVDPRMAEIVTAVANKANGTNNPVISWESWCSTKGPCAQIRHMRAHA